MSGGRSFFNTNDPNVILNHLVSPHMLSTLASKWCAEMLPPLSAPGITLSLNISDFNEKVLKQN